MRIDTNQFSTKLLGFFVLSTLVLTSTNLIAVDAEPIVPRGVRLEHLHTRQVALEGGLTEGPALASDGSIWFSDIASGKDRGRVLRFDPRSKKVSVVIDDSQKSNGLVFDQDGDLILCEGADFGGRRISRFNPDTRKRTSICETFEGKRLNSPNDLCLDSKGRIYFTDPRYNGPETRELKHRSVYRVGEDKKAILVTKQVSRPNGIAISPDGKTLYVADNDNGTDRWVDGAPTPTPGPRAVYAFSLDAKGDVQGDRRTVIDTADRGGVDGMTVDVRGNLYLTLRDRRKPGVLIVDPSGKELGFVPTGAPGQTGPKTIGMPSNCEFGMGSESNVLYVTVDRGLYRVRLNVDGFRHPTRSQRLLLERFRREFVAVKPGEDKFPSSFTMGREGGPPNEKPIKVSMTKAFEMGVYEIPQNLWLAIMGHNPSRWAGPRNSVEMLSYQEAQDFCRRSTELMKTLGLLRAKQRVRLPSEAEWEYCARAGSTTLYSFGDKTSDLGDYAWSTHNAAGNDPPVGAKKPNPWGLYDIHGYLWEWCDDAYAADLKSYPTNGSARPAGDDPSPMRVVRSGSWKDKAPKLTSSFRQPFAAETKDDAVGLRCVIADH